MSSRTHLVEGVGSRGKQDENRMASGGCSPSHDPVRVESRGKMRRTPMANDCLYCGLQFAATTQFCPNCGRPTEGGFSIRPLQESEVDCLRREVQEKDELIRQLILTRTLRGEASRTAVRSTGRRDLCDGDGRRASARVLSSGRSGRKRATLDRSSRPVREPGDASTASTYSTIALDRTCHGSTKHPGGTLLKAESGAEPGQCRQ